jgi:hypothetical protein
MSEPTKVTATAPPAPAPVIDGFVGLGREYRDRKGFGLEFQKDVRGYFLKALARTYWNPVRSFMAQKKWPVAIACKAAGLDPSTHTRWDEMTPTFETICVLFARCDLEMKDVEFPAGHEAFRTAFFRTVEYIRSKHMKEPQSQLDEEMWECLRLVLGAPAVLEALQATGRSKSEDAKEVVERLRQAIEDLVAELVTRFPNGRIKDVAGAEKAISDWLIPWVLFYTVIPPSRGGS